jgi:hypothetical protein
VYNVRACTNGLGSEVSKARDMGSTSDVYNCCAGGAGVALF